MTETRLACPGVLSEGNVASFLETLARHALAAPSMVIDFQTIRYALPFGALCLAQGIRNVVAIRGQYGFHTSAIGAGSNTAAHSYLRHVGFFQWIGLGIGMRPGQASGSVRYIPITDISRASVVGRHGGFHEGVEATSERLAEVMFSSDTENGPYNVVQYCLREVIRNVFEHAEAEVCTVMAQRWGDGTVEIGIIDAGRGILASLSERYEGLTPEQALRLSVRPGISRVAESFGPWGNAGFGLFVLSRCGSFSLVSSGKALLIEDGADVVIDSTLRGTAIKIRRNTDNADYFPNQLAQLVMDGEAVAGAELPSGVRVSRSKTL